MSPKISITVPIYNRGHLLSKCLNSLVNQSFTDIEVLLINDGSTDNSDEVCLEYVKNYPDKFRYHYCENGGVSRARNLGIALAHGEYLGFVDSDDWVEPQFCELLYNSAKRNNADIAACNINLVDKNEIITKIMVDHIDNMGEFMSQSIDRVGAVWNKIFRKKIITHYNLYFLEDCHYAEDLAFTYCAAIVANKILNINECLYNYYQNEQSLTQEWDRKKTALKDLYRVVDFTHYFLNNNNLLADACNSFNKIFVNDILLTWCPRVMRNMMLDDSSKAKQIYSEYTQVCRVYVSKPSFLNYTNCGVNYLKFVIFKTFPRLIKYLKNKT